MGYAKVNSIEWHQECLKNAECHAELLSRTAEARVLEAKQAWKSVTFYAEQINKAIDQGKTKFDAEKFMQKR